MIVRNSGSLIELEDFDGDRVVAISQKDDEGPYVEMSLGVPVVLVKDDALALGEWLVAWAEAQS